ncbi:Actin cytoskeleton-regulatory complex protein sla1 [Fulvia fulva]|uniref:Actin cytoskeleton-regulatory complex protein SLA1 n=1 Tax=Passalora fulva TaxID=5499 RepID=A0A9Q8L795_PASFU|nr:Actin cytoskeleton-regulatory complex protein sla1 [Fulvia fulva]KAK4636188.1 Actin cytoskeleton-regulatory complex protein sla1 [Fulvia fulva]KAK4636627.1 Actin cytoskeleton-regulatory complex protein sla1 [Fulvia fulva]UJO12153.1 Actin cytoskeleton-regulatory complex protein sla1 [Fulvia fulva]WPV09320.1 Actin cytoskeleton-regulatory complex protein sla1 [Fulvia fulva]WPV23208.1 Actin cytoskeleton-regulatory complex protein sla1 [Fulvia fulva]
MPFESVVRAVYDYQPQSEEELEIHEGDLLFVLEKSADDDWWKCKKKASDDDDEEPEGLVPNNYVEDVKAVYQAKALYDYTKQTDEELSFKEEARLDVYDTTDPDWTLVGSDGEFGFAPAIYIERVEATSAVPPARSLAPAPPPMPARPPAANEPIPGEADYPDPGAAPTPSPDPSAHNPAAQLAGIIAQRTGGTQLSPTIDRGLASPPLPNRPQYTPEDSDEEAAPSLPQRPPLQTIPVSPPPPPVQYSSPREARSPSIPSPPRNRVATSYDDEHGDDELRSPGGFHLYNVHEMIQHMGKNKKMPTTLGINIGKGIIMISPEKSRDGPSKEWTADKLTHYSIEGKHVFVELVRPSKSIDFHAGAKDTAQEIVSALGELAGAVRQEGLKEVLAAGAAAGAAGKKKGQMLYEFMAQSEDEVTVGVGDEVIILDDTRSEEWWMVRRMKNGKEGVVPSSYVEVTGRIPDALDSITGLDTARSTVEQNRLEEQRLAKEAAKRDKRRDGDVVPPERHSSLAGDTRRTSMRSSKSKDQSKSKPNLLKVRTWTDRTGSFKVEAEFIGLRDGKIHLHKMNGVKIAVPVSKMAVEDLEYVETATGASLDEDKPLSDIKRRNTQRSKATGQNGTAGASVQKKDDYDWFDFFLQCGVNPQICERYAGAFSRDQMTPEVLPDVTEQLLRTLGLKEGDILRVTKYLDNKYDRKNGAGSSADGASGAEGGLFSGPGGALRNNTRKGRPAPVVQTNDVVDESAFKPKDGSPTSRGVPGDAKATPLTSAPARKATSGFDDDAWDVKPARSQPPTSDTAVAPSPALVDPPKAPGPKINEDLVSLSISSPALEPTPATPTAPAQVLVAQPTAPQQPQAPPVANQAIFDKIASLAPAARRQQPMQTGYQQPMQAQQTALPRQRPTAPQQQSPKGPLNMPPPPRAASAPGFPPQQSQFGAAPLQPQLTGYPPQQFQQLQPQQTSFQGAQGYGQPYQQPNGMQPQMNSIQTMQQNYPSLQPQPTGFQPQSQFGQQAQQLGMAPTGYQQQLVNGAQTGSPFADPPRQQFQPMPSGLSSSFSPQQTGFQTAFSVSQPTGMNGFGAQPTQPVPQLPPQQTGGVFGPSQPLGSQAPPMPLVPQKTGPPPPVRFGVQPGVKPLAPQPTGRANLAKATPQNPFGF